MGIKLYTYGTAQMQLNARTWVTGWKNKGELIGYKGMGSWPVCYRMEYSPVYVYTLTNLDLLRKVERTLPVGIQLSGAMYACTRTGWHRQQVKKPSVPYVQASSGI